MESTGKVQKNSFRLNVLMGVQWGTRETAAVWKSVTGGQVLGNEGAGVVCADKWFTMR